MHKQQKNSLSNSKSLYTLGIFLSILCGIHCLFLPIILVASPFLPLDFLTNPLFEFIILPIAMLIAGWMMYTHYQKHNNRIPLLLFGLGFTGSVLSLVFHNHIVMAFSTSIVAIAQVINWRLHHTQCTDH